MHSIPKQQPQDAATASRWYPLLIVAATTAVYVNSLDGTFLLDDQRYIIDNERIRDLASLGNVLSHRRPLLDLSLAFNYAIHGLQERGYHIFNVLIHMMASLTLYGLVRRTLCRSPKRNRCARSAAGLAFAIAILFAIHPLQTQSVSYIVQRSESMMGLFFLLMLYSIIRASPGHRTGSVPLDAPDPKNAIAHPVSSANKRDQTPLRAYAWNTLAILCCALGIASKSVMVVAPIVALFFDRAFLTTSWAQLIRRRWPLYLGLFATWGILIPTGVATGILSTSTARATVGFSVEDITPLGYLLSQSGVLLRYLSLTIWPTPQCIDYSWPMAITAGEYVSQGLAIVGLLGIGTWTWWKDPRLGFVAVFFFLILAPTSSFVPIRDLAFEHRMYLPLASIIILVVVGFTRLTHALEYRNALPAYVTRNLPSVALAMAAVVLGWTTVERNRQYQSPLAMWEDVVAHRPDNSRALLYYAAALDAEGRRPEATRALRRVLELDPGDPFAHANLGEALYDEGRIDEAIEHYHEAIRIDPLHAIANRNLGQAMLRMGRLDEAIAAFRRAAKAPTHRAQSLFDLCAALYQKGEFADAVVQCEASLRLDPQRYEAHFNLGLALLGLGRREEAIPHLRVATQLQPDMVQLRAVLGSELSLAGRIEEAVIELEKVLTADPTNELARQELSVLRNR